MWYKIYNLVFVIINTIMLRIASSCLFKFNKLSRTTIASYTKRAKNAQLILHTPEQIENMITRSG